MIVNRDTLDIMPIADHLLEKIAGKLVNEVELGEVAISNELALHVIEIKTNGPKPEIAGLDQPFFATVQKLNELLAVKNAVLMPTGMHPWFTPQDDVKLWPHGDKKIYQAYHRIFNCRGHGWANLQSVHLNLPFGNEDEFVRLHQAIRMVLPFIPALAASTPFCEGKRSGFCDTRLNHYGKNQIKIPSIAGKIMPEHVESIDAYHNTILQPMYADIAEFDAEKTLQFEWLNSRGAIARFDRDAIEVRVIDSQESAIADFACVQLIAMLIKHIAANIKPVSPVSEIELQTQYLACIKDGMHAPILLPEVIEQWGLSTRPKHANELWRAVFEMLQSSIDEKYQPAIENILANGNLSERLRLACPTDDAAALQQTYKKLIDCLAQNKVFMHA